MRRSRATQPTTIPDDSVVDLGGLEVDDFFFDGEPEEEFAAAEPPKRDLRDAGPAPALEPPLDEADRVNEPVLRQDTPEPEPPAVPSEPVLERDGEAAWGIEDFFASETPGPAGPPVIADAPPAAARSRADRVHVVVDERLAAAPLEDVELVDELSPARAPRRRGSESKTHRRDRRRRKPRPQLVRPNGVSVEISPRCSFAVAVLGVVLALAALTGAVPRAGQSPAIAAAPPAERAARPEKAISGAHSVRPIAGTVEQVLRKGVKAARARKRAVEQRAQARARARAAAQRRARAHRAARRRTVLVRRAAVATTAPARVAPARTYSPPAPPAARPSVPRNRPAAKSPAGKEFGW